MSYMPLASCQLLPKCSSVQSIIALQPVARHDNMRLLLAVAAVGTTTHALKPMNRRAVLLGVPSALALPTPTHAQEMTKTASGLEYYDVKVGQGDGPAKLDNTVTIDCACPASFALQYTPPTRFPRRHRLAQRLRGQGVFEV